jgi:hypothetical protein
MSNQEILQDEGATKPVENSVRRWVNEWFKNQTSWLNLQPAHVTKHRNEAWNRIFRRETANVVLQHLKVNDTAAYCGLTLQRTSIGCWTVQYVEEDRLRSKALYSIPKALDYIFGEDPNRESRETSRYRGVYRNANGWSAIISVKGDHVYLGWRRSEEETAQLYNDYVVAKELNRELNRIEVGAGS